MDNSNLNDEELRARMLLEPRDKNGGRAALFYILLALAAAFGGLVYILR